MTDAELRTLSDSLSLLLRPVMDRQPEVRRAVALIGQWLIEIASTAETARAEPGGSAASIPAQTPTANAAPSTISLPPSPAPAAAAAPAPAPATAQHHASPHAASEATPIVVREQKLPLRLGNSILHVDVYATDDEARAATLAASNAKRSTARDEVRGSSPAREEDAHAGCSQPDLNLIARRSRLKARSCIHSLAMAATNEGSREREALLEPMRELIAQAKAMQSCFLWVFYKQRATAAASVIERCAWCYEALADAAELAARVEAADVIGSGVRSGAFQALAQAQSALRVALQDTWLTNADQDQDDAYRWLAAATARYGIRIDRYLRLSDPASPEDTPRLRQRIALIGSDLDSARSRKRAIDAALKRIRYHVRNISRSSHPATCDRDLYIIERTLGDLDELGVGSREPVVDAVLKPLKTTVTEGVTDSRPLLARWAGIGAADDAADLADSTEADTRPKDEEQDSEAEEQEGKSYSERVGMVRSMLAGQGIVIIGGQCREEARRRIQTAFQADWVEWVAIREHASGAPMRAPISRPNAAIVLIFIKLAGHLHVDEARTLAQRASIPAINITAGYNPEQLAHCILDQASERLQLAAPARQAHAGSACEYAATASVGAAMLAASDRTEGTPQPIITAPTSEIEDRGTCLAESTPRHAEPSPATVELPAPPAAEDASSTGDHGQVANQHLDDPTADALGEVCEPTDSAEEPQDLPDQADRAASKRRQAKPATKPKPARKKRSLVSALAASISPAKPAPIKPVDRIVAGPRLFPGGAPPAPIPDAPAVLSASLIDGPLAAAPVSRLKARPTASNAMKVLARAGSPTILGGG